MKPPSLWAVSWSASLLLAAIAGCGTNSATGGNGSGLADGPEAASTAWAIPVVYSSYGNPAPLTDEQLEEVTQVARDACPQGRELWFIHVRHHQLDTRSNAIKSRYRVVAYYTPDQESPRFRKGRCAYLDNDVAPAQRRQVVAALGKGYAWPMLEPYVQISGPRGQFDARPHGARPGAPSETELPIFPPKEVADDDLVAIVDAARSAHAGAAGADADEPLLRITLEGATYQVDFGWQAGPLNGRGSTIKVKRSREGFVADVAVATWAS